MEQLKVWNCRFDEAENASEALNKLRQACREEEPFQVALLDYQMPEMDGVHLARQIKEDEQLAATRLLLLTSVPRRGDAARMMRAGFEAYLTKPIKQSHLYDALALVAGHKKEEQQPKAREKIITRHTINEVRRSKLRILLAEDNVVNQKVACRMLEKLGYRCDVAANGQEAVQALTNIPYHLIFMDCQMPEMDGYEATQKIRQMEQEQEEHTVIVAMTANAMPEDREKCLRAGMDDYISKPIKLDLLCQILDKYMGNRLSPGSKLERETKKSEGPIDLERLSQAAGEDPEFENELLELFLEDQQERVENLRDLIQQEDYPLLQREAHTLKGASANLGISSLQRAALLLETAVKEEKWGELQERAQVVETEFDRVSTFIQNRLKNS
jgi:CheY-like chemotaxis protein/HPt (histidine-containing phosphotransfer) domain-containing protein